jgi:DNA-binding CsgD family transcriptional regulator
MESARLLSDSPQLPRLVGRASDLEAIEAFLDRVSARGDALLLFGDPGVGKTAVLRAAEELAHTGEFLVLGATGAEFEQGLAFSGLHQLMQPLADVLGTLEQPERQALSVALGFVEGRPPGQLVVANAVLGLLRRTAIVRPTLILVDDLPWLDRASTTILGLVARRLAGSRLGFLAASRTGEESFFNRAGLAEHELLPLDPDAARLVLSDRFPTLGRAVKNRVLAEAQGNPLALLELPLALAATSTGLTASVPTIVPLTRRLERLFGARIRTLPHATRRLLLLAALDASGEAAVLRSAGSNGGALQHLVAAERAQLARFDLRTNRIEFRHSLVRSCLVANATSYERRQAHLDLAELLAGRPAERAWHMADATVEPDEHVAQLMEDAARTILGRGDAIGAIRALTRAAELSPPGRDRARRLAQAAYVGAEVTGEMRSASEVLADAQRADPVSPHSLSTAATAAFVLLNTEGDVDTAHRLLAVAIESAPPESKDGLEEALNTLALVCFFGGRAELWQLFYAGLARFGSDVPATLSLIGTCFADPIRTGVAAKPALDDAIGRLDSEADPTAIIKVGFAAGNSERLSECRRAFRRVALSGRETGAVGLVIQALVLLAYEHLWSGAWEEALAMADESLQLCEAHGFPLFAYSVHHIKAIIAAARGAIEDAQALLDVMTQYAAPRGVGLMGPIAAHVRGLMALGRGDFDQAYELMTRISPVGTLPPHRLMAQWVIMDVVEAAMRTGREAEAAAHAAAVQAANVSAISPRLALLAGASAALAASDDTAVALFDRAIATPGGAQFRFNFARVEFAYGQRLRRLRAPAEARTHLDAALAIFDGLGARQWSTRAEAELRAAGGARTHNENRDRDELTPQEREIALLAATGLSNKQIGERLFLSHRTVGFHLHRIFPKLGVSSRAALRDALESLDAGAATPR